MKLTTVLFDLDGTLLPMDQERFVEAYFSRLGAWLAPFGYDPHLLIKSIWKGTVAMVGNDGGRTNEEVFWGALCETFGKRILEDAPRFESFYSEKFDEVRESCGFDPRAAQAIAEIRRMGFDVALATNPLFPAVATQSRIRWAGLEISDFALVTTFENSRYCKPNPLYYQDVARTLGVSPSECLMVGNDVQEDMEAASAAGMKCFLLTDCLIDRTGKSAEAYPRGSFPALLELVKNLNT